MVMARITVTRTNGISFRSIWRSVLAVVSLVAIAGLALFALSALLVVAGLAALGFGAWWYLASKKKFRDIGIGLTGPHAKRSPQRGRIIEGQIVPQKN